MRRLTRDCYGNFHGDSTQLQARVQKTCRWYIFPFPSKKKATASFSSHSFSSSSLFPFMDWWHVVSNYREVEIGKGDLRFDRISRLSPPFFLFLLRSEKRERKGKRDWERKEGSGHIFLLFLLLLFWIESRIKRGKWKRERSPVRIFLNFFVFWEKEGFPFFKDVHEQLGGRRRMKIDKWTRSAWNFIWSSCHRRRRIFGHAAIEKKTFLGWRGKCQHICVGTLLVFSLYG